MAVISALSISAQETQRPIRLWRYLAATVMPIVLVVVATFIIIAERRQSIAIANNGMAGIDVITGINNVVIALQKVRGLWQIRLQGGSEAVTQQLQEQGAAVESALGDLLSHPEVVRLQLLGPLQSLRNDLEALGTRVSDSSRPQVVFELYSANIDRLLELMQQAAIRSTLVLDPNGETYHLSELVVKRLPETAEAIGRLRGIASGLALKKTIDQQDQVELQRSRGRLKEEVTNLLRSHHAALRVLGDNEGYAHLAVESFVTTTESFEQGILGLINTEQGGKEFRLFSAATKLLSLNNDLHYQATSQLYVILEQRVQRLQRLIDASILIALLTAVLIGACVYGFYWSHRRTLSQLMLGIERLRHTEQELHKHEQYHQATIRAALDGIIIINQGGKVIDFNPSAEKIFGYCNDEIQGRDIADLIIPPAYRERHKEGLKRYRETGSSQIVGQHVELTALNAKGREFPIELTITPVEYQGGTIFTAFVRDITDRTQLQQQLKQAQKMEAIGQLTGGIAHDFNNMLTSIMGYAELARDGLPWQDVRKLRNYLGHILMAGARARDLVSQMLAFSRGGEGELSPMPLAPLIKDSLKMLGSSLPSSIEIDLRLEDERLQASTNPVQLHQLLMSLCINARDAMEGKGRIIVGLRRLNDIVNECSSCHEFISGDFIELSIRDSGSGMTNQQLEHIFEPFYTTKEVGKGTGMGLPMVHGIMHGHGGHIVVDTGPTKGSTFRLLFPIVQVQRNGADSSINKVDLKIISGGDRH